MFDRIIGSAHKWPRRGVLLGMLLTASLGTPVVAADGDQTPGLFSVGMLVSATTDYVSRGLSQTDGGPALQGTAEASYTAGPDWLKPMAGIFLSNVDFPGADVELDPYIGARGVWGGFKYEVLAIYYAYPGAGQALEYQFWEFGGSLSRQVGKVLPTVGLLYSPDFFADSGKQFYPFVSASLPFRAFERDWNVTGKFSRRFIEYNDRFFLPDYNAWMISVDTTILGLAWSAYYADTDIGDRACPTGICAARFVVQLSRKF